MQRMAAVAWVFVGVSLFFAVAVCGLWLGGLALLLPEWLEAEGFLPVKLQLLLGRPSVRVTGATLGVVAVYTAPVALLLWPT